MRYRNRVLGMLALLLVITYLDRVCMSVAGPRIQEELHLGPVAWGWVAAVFTLSFGIFEIPTGILGDRIGPRKVLTRIVLWWSVFTSLTGMVTGYYPLLATRFLFGIGEAGAYPNASIVVSRWFPLKERSRAFGVVLMSAQLGGVLAPLLVVPIQIHFGWRASFYIFGVVGVIWSIIWWLWFRDSPVEKSGISQQELAESRNLPTKSQHGLPWSIALRSGNFWSTLIVALCYVYTLGFFSSWFHTFLVRARGFSEGDLLLSSLPFIVGACSNLAGGLTSNLLVRKMGLKWGRCLIASLSLALSAVCAVGVIFVHGQPATLVLISIMAAGILFQQPIMFAVCLDIGGPYAGAMVGAMNTTSQIGNFLSALVFGYLVNGFSSYTLPFIPMAALLLLGAILWLRVDPTRPLIPAEAAT